jgi:hypothetical protein
MTADLGGWASRGSGLVPTGTGPDDFGYQGSYGGEPGGLEHFGARLYDPSTGR